MDLRWHREMQPLVSDSALSPKQTKEFAVQEVEAEARKTESAATATLENNGMPHSQALLQVSRSHVRWGVVRMPPEWYMQFSDAGHEVEHLTFGARDQGIEDAQASKYYA
ncbi:hypothetical protein N431DRAFT_475035 [Stipitochalara longipes BDJ]|nr:hypothetical protein N431DRAFT_475035 [Stipitochalara longipes BDJ]